MTALVSPSDDITAFILRQTVNIPGYDYGMAVVSYNSLALFTSSIEQVQSPGC
jgi:hypothetical protein